MSALRYNKRPNQVLAIQFEGEANRKECVEFVRKYGGSEWFAPDEWNSSPPYDFLFLNDGDMGNATLPEGTYLVWEPTQALRWCDEDEFHQAYEIDLGNPANLDC